MNGASKAASSGRWMLFSAALAAASALSFVLGLGTLFFALRAPSPSGSKSAASGGFFESITNAASGALTGGDEPAAAGFRGSQPVGLYLMSRYWIATRSLEKAVWYFTPDGRVYVDPELGFSDEALAAHKGRQGTIRTDGNQMTIKWNDGDEDQSDVERSGGRGFGWDGALFAPVTPFANRSDLVGKWEGGTSMSFSGATAMTSNSLDLRDDGTLTRGSAASLGSESEENRVTAGSTGQGTGTWTLSGYSLTITDNGEVQQGIAFPFDDEQTAVYPDRFYFRGTLYKKLGEN